MPPCGDAIFDVMVSDMEVTERRTYRMSARAEATAETGERILDAAVQLFWEHPSDQISLEAVAAKSGVTVRTVIRRFGSKEALLAEGIAREAHKERSARDMAPVGDISAAVATLVANYEITGERALRMLAEEQRLPSLAPIVDAGRAVHRNWCADTFAPALTGLHGSHRRRTLAKIVAVCDVYTWKVLRRDLNLTRDQTVLAMVELLAPMMKES